ncbi:MAG: ACP S-malonyltransferase [Vicinamibacterales bacterium]
MIAFLFPGQGSQTVGMGKALADHFPECRQVFDQADDALGEPLSDLIFHGPADTLTLTENAQPAILTVSTAVYRLLVSHGIEPQRVAGHSLGEYSAHVAAGTMSFADAVRLVRHRGRYMQEAVPAGTGAMAAILGLGVDKVAQACVEAAEGEVVSPANLNAPGQVVIAGAAAAVARAIGRARALGAKRAVPLHVSAPFHCALMKPAEERLAPELRVLKTKPPRVPIVANVDAQPKIDAHAAVEALIQQVSAPVRWEAVMRRLVADRADVFVEVGPGTVLSRLGRKIASDVTYTHIDSPEHLEHVVALVATHQMRSRV